MYIPPVAVAEAAKKGIAIRNSMPQSRKCCTPVGIRRGQQLANREAVSIDILKRMSSYFSRHEVDRSGKGWGVDSKGWQAWLMWGGDPGRAWVNSILKPTKNPRSKLDYQIERLHANLLRLEVLTRR
jgi:hypothetical protein